METFVAGFPHLMQVLADAGIVVYVILQQISFKNQKFEIHELIDISATMLLSLIHI